MDQRTRRKSDRDILLGPLSEREAMIADAATRIAFDLAGDWLSMKQAKAEQFPGWNAEHSKGCASAYRNAAQEIYGWAIAHQPEDHDGDIDAINIDNREADEEQFRSTLSA